MRVLHFQVPHIQLPHLVPQSQHLETEQGLGQTQVQVHAARLEEAHLLPEVHGKTHVPDVTLAVVKPSQDGHVGLVGFDVVHIVLHFSWFPANDGVLARLPKTC